MFWVLFGVLFGVFENFGDLLFFLFLFLKNEVGTILRG
jgi:hypothetical protein